jgi:hypothetical protein
MRIALWAFSEEDALARVRTYLERYQWHLLGAENTCPVDPAHDSGDEINCMIDETKMDKNAIRFGTFYSYPVQ